RLGLEAVEGQEAEADGEGQALHHTEDSRKEPHGRASPAEVDPGFPVAPDCVLFILRRKPREKNDVLDRSRFRYEPATFRNGYWPARRARKRNRNVGKLRYGGGRPRRGFLAVFRSCPRPGRLPGRPPLAAARPVAV